MSHLLRRRSGVLYDRSMTTHTDTPAPFRPLPDCYPVHCEADAPCPRHARVEQMSHAEALARCTGAREVTYAVERHNEDGSITTLSTERFTR